MKFFYALQALHIDQDRQLFAGPNCSDLDPDNEADSEMPTEKLPEVRVPQTVEVPART